MGAGDLGVGAGVGGYRGWGAGDLGAGVGGWGWGL